jgi:hypothetical protein
MASSPSMTRSSASGTRNATSPLARLALASTGAVPIGMRTDALTAIAVSGTRVAHTSPARSVPRIALDGRRPSTRRSSRKPELLPGTTAPSSGASSVSPLRLT